MCSTRLSVRFATAGVLGLALRPPVSVDEVATAAAGGALGRVSATRVDGTDEINGAANQARAA